jgi:hypothetical protein
MAERYMALNGKYLEDADRLLAEGDFVQASEKYWGAMAEMVKVVAHLRGWRHFSHLEMKQAVSRLATEQGDTDWIRLFGEAEALHANFYENFMSEDRVRSSSTQAKELIEKLLRVATAG